MARAPSLARRFTLGFALAAFGVVGLSVGMAYLALVRNLDAEDDAVLRQAAGIAQSRLEAGQPLTRGDETRMEAVLLRVLDPSGREMLGSPTMDRVAPQAAFSSAPAALVPFERRLPEGTTFRGLVLPTHMGLVQVAMDRTHEEKLLVRHRLELALILLGATALAAALGWVLSRRGLRPVSELAMKAGAIRPETLGSRLDSAALPEELRALAEAINSALARLEEAFARLSDLASDLAHELRTPLNALRLELDTWAEWQGVHGEALGRVLEQVQHLQDLVAQMLFLARTEDPATVLNRQDLGVAEEVAKALAPFEPWAEEEGVTLSVNVPQTLHLEADPILLRRALHNLLGNALRHTPSGGRVDLRAEAKGREVILEVANTGEGIPAEALAKLGQRFRRLDPSRSRASGGLGLGLAIVRGILKLHGGEVELESQEGRGTVARIRFPF